MLYKIKVLLSFITILSQEPSTKLRPAISEDAPLPELMAYYEYKVTPADSVVHIDVTKGTLLAQKRNY